MAGVVESREWHLAAYAPEGVPTSDHLKLRTVTLSLDVDSIPDHHLIVQNIFISVDPYQRTLMSGLEDGLYFPQIKLNEAVRLLLDSGVDINAKNLMGDTAGDILVKRQGVEYSRSSMEISEMLQRAEVTKCARYLRSIVLSLEERRLLQVDRWAKISDDRRNVLLVVATLLMTVTYQGLLSPPGGLWQDDYNPGSDLPNATKPDYRRINETDYLQNIAGTVIGGLPGFAAWVGIEVLGDPKPGSNVFVSAAAGGVGMFAGQLAKLKGCRVIGSTGSDEKVGCPHNTFFALLRLKWLPGFAAWVGIEVLGDPKPGSNVFVSAAAGGVGMFAGQLAKLKGCRVIGSTGSDEKVKLIKEEFGYDDAFNYKTETDLDAALSKYFPNGIDIYFDNVGGEMLEAVHNHVNRHARIPVCGMISQYKKIWTERQGVRNLLNMVGKEVRMEGFLMSSHLNRFGDFAKEIESYIKEGKISSKLKIYHGIESYLESLGSLFTSSNFGKVIIEVQK
ncbi:nadph-dependent oxidoreductase 2-alkenal reductase [Quercus suber]|uniref:Nadph-dependent oxidoreductase 2-alkenal reductase n=1 Tax=Quercus suber TaxID=58331 RepID=A0AAW0LBG0_QUESU